MESEHIGSCIEMLKTSQREAVFVTINIFKIFGLNWFVNRV